MKAFLLLHGWKLRRTHDLEALLNEALAYEESLEIFRDDCQKIAAFYLVDRYPLSPGPGITEMDVRESMERTRELVEKLRKAIEYTDMRLPNDAEEEMEP